MFSTFSFFFILPPPRSTLFPYTTLFRSRLRPHLDLDPTPDRCPALTPSRTRPTPDTGTDPSDRAPPSRRFGKACLSELFALRWSLRVDRASGALSGHWAAGPLGRSHEPGPGVGTSSACPSSEESRDTVHREVPDDRGRGRPPAAASAREVLPRECTGEHLPRAARRPSAPAQRSAGHHDLGPAAVAALRPARSGRSSLRGAGILGRRVGARGPRLRRGARDLRGPDGEPSDRAIVRSAGSASARAPPSPRLPRGRTRPAPGSKCAERPWRRWSGGPRALSARPSRDHAASTQVPSAG